MSMPGFWELLALGVIALLVFGPDRLPGVIQKFGKTVGTVRREARTAINELKATGELDELRGAARELRSETDALRQEGRSAGDELRRVASDDPAKPTGRRGATGGDAVARNGATPTEPAPFDPDTP